MMTPHDPTQASEIDWQLASKCIAGFVAIHLIYRGISQALEHRLGSMLELSFACSISLGIALSFALCGILGALARRGLAIALASAVVLAVPISVAFAVGDLTSHYFLSSQVNGAPTTTKNADGAVVTQSASGETSYRQNAEERHTVVELSPMKMRVREEAISIIARNVPTSYFFFFGLGALFVGMSSARRLQAAERKASEFERLAHSAQLMALRYQVNPHLLFNTLNSLSSLVMSRRLDEAETMILNLSAFFRSALAINPTEDVPLSEEIRLQRLYLNIEAARFPGRLHVDVTVPPMLEAAHVPALLLQPLIENAIKHGVSRTNERVTIAIIAEHLRDDAMRLIVENSGGAGSESFPNPDGAGVGLANVRERLQARFGAAASCQIGTRSGGGYRVALTLPVVRT
jgi:LytS/YehU family sensor histidine kinase